MTTAAAAIGATVVAVLAATLQILHCACPLARIGAVASIVVEAVAFRMGRKWSAAIVVAGRVRFCMT